MSIVVETLDANGFQNGWLLPLWNVNERPDLKPSQVYLTVIAPGRSKGPHLHKRREQRYYCIRGQVEVIVRDEETQEYTATILGVGDSTVVLAGTPSQLRNDGALSTGHCEAWIINMPSPAWSVDDQDEWPVENWTA